MFHSVDSSKIYWSCYKVNQTSLPSQIPFYSHLSIGLRLPWGTVCVRQLKRCKNWCSSSELLRSSSISHRSSFDRVAQVPGPQGKILKFNCYVIVKDTAPVPLGISPLRVPLAGYSYSRSIYKCLPVYEGLLVEERTDVSVWLGNNKFNPKMQVIDLQ